MPVLELVFLGTALAGVLAAVVRQSKHGGSAGRRHKARAALPPVQHCEDRAKDERLLRELLDDVELKLRRLRRLPPGEERSEGVRLLRRQYSSGTYASNERLAPLLAKFMPELERRTAPLLGSAPAAISSRSSSGSYSASGSLSRFPSA